MNHYKVYDPSGDFTWSEDRIIEEYWPYWSKAMLDHGGLSPRITRENCIDDWCVVNWAELV